MISVLRVTRPANVQAWIAANAPGSLKATGRESWRAYLASLGGTGGTLIDLERSVTLTLSGGNTKAEAFRNTYK